MRVLVSRLKHLVTSNNAELLTANRSLVASAGHRDYHHHGGGHHRQGHRATAAAAAVVGGAAVLGKHSIE